MISNGSYLSGRLRPVRRAVLTLATLAFCLGVTSAVEVLGQNRIIGNIEFVGLKRLKTNEVIASSGLGIGQAFDLKALDAATQKLADSGLFDSIGYRTQSSGNKVTIIFTVGESKAGNSPVIFDNFVWFIDAELMEAVRREVPSFNGTAPNAGQTIDLITAALQKLLKAHNIKGSVDYFPSQDDLGSAAMLHAFTVSGNVLRVDEDYSDDFIKHSLGEILGQKAGCLQLKTVLRPNKNSLTVDVSFEIVK